MSLLGDLNGSLSTCLSSRPTCRQLVTNSSVSDHKDLLPGTGIKILNDISFYCQTHDYVRLFTLDMSKAFDTILHESIWRGLKLKPTLHASFINYIADFQTNRVIILVF